jgi:hypothetical protein
VLRGFARETLSFFVSANSSCGTAGTESENCCNVFVISADALCSALEIHEGSSSVRGSQRCSGTLIECIKRIESDIMDHFMSSSRLEVQPTYV